MSTMSIKQFRIGDKPTSLVNMHLRKHNDICSIRFVSDHKELYVLSTDEGSVSKNQVILQPSNKREVNIILDDSSERVECFISYMIKNELQDHETLETIAEKTEINQSIQDHKTIATHFSGNAKNKMTNFIKSMENMKSPWKIGLEYDHHIKIKVISAGNTKGLFAIGEESKELLCNDFVFSIYPNNDLLLVPKELIENKHKCGSILSVYELVKPDFMKAANSLFKVKISNSLAVNDLEKHFFKSIWHFKTPCGSNFDPSKWKIGSLGLPTRVSNE